MKKAKRKKSVVRRVPTNASLAKAKAKKKTKIKPILGDKVRKSKKVRAYEGAAKTKRTQNWRASSASADQEIKAGGETLRNRARDLRRNNPYAAKIISVITSNVIGAGIQTNFNGDGDSEVAQLEFNEWAGTTACDFDGRNNLAGLQKIAMDAVAESGEVLIRKRTNPKKSIPLQYQILEADFLDTNRTEGATGGNFISEGIEYDRLGRRRAYWIFEYHPSNSLLIGYNQQKSNRIPAEDIIHAFRQDRPGQNRGVTFLAPVMVRLRDLDQFEDAQLMKQKVAACFTAFVQDLSADFIDEDTTDEENIDISERLEPGIIEKLPPNKTITFSNPPTVADYKSYMQTVLHGIAAGVGVTYEAMTGDYENVNYSSGRMGFLEFHRNIQVWRKHIIEGPFLDKVAQDFLDTLAIMGVNVKGISFGHVPPKRDMVDPTKEIPATIEAIQGGLTSLSDELMAQGKDPKVVFAQMKKDMDELDRLGIKITSDARNIIQVTEKSGGADSEQDQVAA